MTAIQHPSTINFRSSFFIIIGLSLLIRFLWLSSYDLLVEEAYYWNYAQHLDFGYLDHPPMVALLIKFSTTIFGTNEFGVRLPALLCWVLTAVFSFKLSNLISSKSGHYAVLLLAILPFFFLQSGVMTPDEPLLVCWSAALYCLYRALVLDQAKYWYSAGLWIGLGMLSKYSIVLLAPATLLYLCLVPTARVWFRRKEPYLGALIALLLFAPVIYWNATHEWASFIFQSSRRVKSSFYFSFHHLLGTVFLFLMPLGALGLWQLYSKRFQAGIEIDIKQKRFLQLFTLVPLAIFGLFSLSHNIRFNWVGPGLLALVPWLALLLNAEFNTETRTLHKGWLITAILSLLAYSILLLTISAGRPEFFHQKFLRKYIAWDSLVKDFNSLSKQIEKETKSKPIIVPMDSYNLSSELAFYQAKLLANKDIEQSYPTMGRHIFGSDSLMYRYWDGYKNLSGKTLILISKDLYEIENFYMKLQVIDQSPLQIVWAHPKRNNSKISPYFYKVAKIRSSVLTTLLLEMRGLVPKGSAFAEAQAKDTTTPTFPGLSAESIEPKDKSRGVGKDMKSA